MRKRKGIALVAALFITLLASSLIAATLTLVDRFNRDALQHTIMFVDHTTVIGLAQAEKARIVETNIDVGTTMSAPDLEIFQNTWPATIPAADLLTSPDQFIIPNENNDLRRRIIVREGAGLQTAFVTVFDMYFDRSWIAPAALREFHTAFPPILDMSGGEAVDPWEQDEPPTTSGVSQADTPPGRGRIPAQFYGSYLIRVELFPGDLNERPPAHVRPARMVEEAFVQILPQP